MSLGSPKSSIELLGLVAVILGVVGSLWAGGNKVYEITGLIATKEYHHQSMDEAIQQKIAPMEEDLKYTVSAVAVPRMQNILDLKCATEGDVPEEVDTILQRTKKRYREIEGRDFDEGVCHEGKRISTYEARKLGLIR